MPKIQKYKTTTMQRIQNCVSLKYYLYTRGQCPPEKILNLVDKFDNLYNINLTKDQRYYRNKKGQSVCRLFIYQHHKENYFIWWLLVTEGTGIIHDREHLKDTRRKHERLKWNLYLGRTFLP